jgi:hypothetical protein
MEPKRPKSKASIPIVAQLKTLLDRHRAECGNPTRGFVFANASGNAMNLEALARDVIRPAIKESGLEWHGWRAFRRGLATNLHRLGISDKVIQQLAESSPSQAVIPMPPKSAERGYCGAESDTVAV